MNQLYKQLLCLAVVLTGFATLNAQNFYYVKTGGTGDGSSWASASGDFQAMVNAASAGDEVWVAAGAYSPALNQSFTMKEGVKIYGGFPDTGNPAMNDRDWLANASVLTGNNNTVITSTGHTNATVLNGFSITGGNNPAMSFTTGGGGISIINSAPVIENIEIYQNSAFIGAGIFCSESGAAIRNVNIHNNQATHSGGGIFINMGSTSVLGAAITDNTSYYGSGIEIMDGAATFTNLTIVGNQANASGCGLYIINSTVDVYNSILWNNINNQFSTVSNINASGTINYFHSLIQDSGSSNWNSAFGTDGGNNIDGDPLFVDAGAGNYALQLLSPAVNSGDTTAFTDAENSLDLAGNPRAAGSAIDMGAYERVLPLTRYVKEGGTGDGTSWANASGDLQAMINASMPDDGVWVAAGTYQRAAGQYFSMKEGVKIYGGFPATGDPGMGDIDHIANETILQGNGSHVIRNNSSGLTEAALLDGFTITGGTAASGGGISNWGASPTLRNLKIHNNTSGFGGGILNINNAAPVITNVIITENNGSGITNFNSDAIIRNSLITNNTNGGIYNENSSATITNVTLSGNTSDVGQEAIVITNGGSVEVGNCIIFGNANGSTSVSDADVYFYNNLIEGGLPGWDEGGAPDGNIDADPLFTDAANGDYSLQQGSPAIDAGDTNLFDNAENETDLAGNSRVYGFSIDMGAFESIEDIIAPIRYVRNGGSGNGLSWENASGDIQAMIDQSLPGDEVWVAQGGYSADSDVPFSMKEGVKIYGGFPEEGDPVMEDRNWKLYPTELYGSGGRVFYNENLSSDSVLDGFFIYSGYTSEDGAGIFNDNVNAVFSNLVIEGNYAEGNGGGMYNSSSNPTLINISFRYNEAASNGGALYNEGNVAMFNVLISNNIAGYGAGMYNFGAFTINVTNTLVTKNHAYTDGGGILNGYDATTNINNSIILNNTLDSGSGENIYIEDGFTINSSYSLIQGSGGSTGWNAAFGTDGGNNIDADPMFVDAAGNNYRLQPDSPAVDAGNTAAFADAENAVDFAGNPRLSGSAIDMGIYERSNAAGTIRYVMQDGTGGGTSWADASGDLQAMMDISSYDDEVWVAAGTYSAPEDDYFYMREGVKVYGGFAATGDPGFSDRDWIANTTTLSGNGAGVVYNETLSNATVLNGFTITGGTSDYQGGGIYNSEANVRLENLIITNNTAGGVGGGISNSYSNIVLTNVRITNNSAQYEGGGIFSEGGNPVLVNVLIDNNNADTGAGIYCGYTTITFTNVTIADNQAASNIGGLYNNYEAFTTVVNSVIWGNTESGNESNIYIGEDSSADFSYSLIQGSGGSSAWNAAFGTDNGNNIDIDPLFTNTVNGDYTLQSESPAKNAGNDAAFDTAFTTTDLAGNQRISDSAIDMGPYEGSLGPCGTLTTWNGSSWSQGQPVSNAYAAFIEGDFDSAENGEITACSLTVTSGTVTVADGDDFVIKGAVTVTGGSLTFGHNSNLIQEDDVANSGNITYQRNSSPLYRLDYTFWSSPVTGQQLQAFSPGTLSNRFYIYDTAPDAYTPIDPTGNFETGKGYLIRMPNTWPDFVNEETPGTSWTGSFTGVPNNGTIPVEVSTEGERYNAIGNPYPSPISIQDFLSANESVLDSGAALYFWRKRNDPDVSSYASITLMGYAPNEVPGGDSDQAFFPDDAVETWVINPGQGFIIRTYDPTIERMDNPDEVMFTNTMRRGTNNGQFFRNNNPGAISRFRLIISGSEPGQYCQAIIGYTDITTTGLDYGWDGRSFSDGAVTLFSVNDDVRLAIQARAAFDVNDVVPVGYTAEVPGSYTITLGTFDGVFEDGQDIYLIDKVTNMIHNLKDSSYTFATEAGEFTDRFEVVYMEEALGTNNPVADANSVIVYKQGHDLHINSGSVDMVDVTIYDTRGRMLYNRQGINTAKTVISDLQAQEQVLIVEINTPNGKVSKKVIY